MNASGTCSCHHHKLVPLMIVLIGLAFLLRALDIVDGDIIAIVWPVLLIVAGLSKLAGHKCACCGKMQ
ncbi:MAG TPA: DUF5668 domain-containing protein [Candidatus Paceibacterota bacterium]|nr:DUF5668 domain-containing protein [Candidatus Paceibacterota bacterium]